MTSLAIFCTHIQGGSTKHLIKIGPVPSEEKLSENMDGQGQLLYIVLILWLRWAEKQHIILICETIIETLQKYKKSYPGNIVLIIYNNKKNSDIS